jgi:hypothetical protein
MRTKEICMARMGTITVTAVLFGVTGCKEKAAQPPPSVSNTAPGSSVGSTPEVPAPPTAKPTEPTPADPAGGEWKQKDLATVPDQTGQPGGVFTGTLELPPDAQLKEFKLSSGDLIPTGTIAVGAVEIGLMQHDKPLTLERFKSVNKVKPDTVVKEESRPGGFGIVYRSGKELVAVVNHGTFGCDTRVTEQAQADLAYRICSSYQPAKPSK